ncbi:MerR family transcriptional regulator [Brevundimonas sp. PAMC22021]|uniref:MerR family transcriptional regulator n=1 Tax=Brevundimonas sp. PAMC22021 TaxID=2861285 RepID=UPI001C634EC6|nr:MerR family transcriptional regulator [Brevundimonas sp. PAMC22021]QYF87982.1 MerR family transcriptional regulator [Brevundimonas sp. PAMC22021]
MAAAPSGKSAAAFRTISEAAEAVGAPQHVLRFWETKFAFVAPVKRAGGRRFYRPADIETLKAIRRLLHDEGMTIRGVERLYQAGGLKRILGEEATVGHARASIDGSAPADDLQSLLAELEAAATRLNAVLKR